MEKRNVEMKIAIISDIHSNFEYLKVISAIIKAESVQQIVFLGDAVGYYDEPNLVLDWLRDNLVFCIKGNHEKYLLNEIKYDSKREILYRIALQRSIISNENLKYIETWKDQDEIVLDGKKIFISHSGFEDCEKYCRSVLDLNKDKLSPYDYYLFGHTHVPWIEYFYGTCILNPGSVGQPRDYSGSPSFSIIELNSNTVTLFKPKIDVSKYQQHLTSLQYDPQIINILSRTT
jgi:putative phosphoesterase